MVTHPVPRLPLLSICGINPAFAGLSPSTGYVPMFYSPVRHSPPSVSTCAAVRLACVRHAASVQSEPGSNSSSLTSFAVLDGGPHSKSDDPHFYFACASIFYAILCYKAQNRFLSQAPALIGCNFLKNFRAPFTVLRYGSFPLFQYKKDSLPLP